MFSVGDIVRLKDGRDTASGIDIEHGWPLDNDGETVRFDVLMKVKTIGPEGEIYVVFPQWCNVDAVDVNDNNEGKGWKMGAGDIEALVPGDAVTPFKKTAKHYEGVVFPNDGIYVKTVPVGSTYGSGTFTDTEPVLIIGKNNIGTTPIQGNYYRWDDLVAGTPATLPARTPAPEPFVIPTYSMIVNGEARVVYGEGNYLKLPDYLENKFIIHEAFYREVFGLSSAITGSAQYHPGDSEFDTSCTGFEEFLQDYVAERPEVERTITVDTSIANDTSDMELILL
jgi:hypothetical protein